MLLSLVLATLGRCDDVEHLLKSLFQQTDKRFELIVVDQNLDDRLVPLCELARNMSIAVTHLRMSEANLSAARNKGIRAARGAIIGFPDDDCWYEPETVCNVISAFNESPELSGLVGRWVEQANERDKKFSDDILSLKDWRNFRGGDASSISLFFRKRLFDEIGGFDEHFGVGQRFGAGEETDFVIRALTAGRAINRCQTVLVHHYFSISPASDSYKAFSRARGTGALYAKHRLGFYVTIRGLLSPMFRGMFPFPNKRRFVNGLAVSSGRLTGLVLWSLGKK